MNLNDLPTPPYDLVADRFDLPFPLYPYQRDTVNSLAWRRCAGYYLWAGTGKTITAIVSCLYKLSQGEVDCVLVLMPPILMDGWKRAIESVPGAVCTVYRGVASKRSKIRGLLSELLFARKIEGAGSTCCAGTVQHRFILMGFDIFKRDYRELVGWFDEDGTCSIEIKV
jgi:hypothetical protein